MPKPYLSLQPSESVVTTAAAVIYAARLQVAGETSPKNKKES